MDVSGRPCQELYLCSQGNPGCAAWEQGLVFYWNHNNLVAGRKRERGYLRSLEPLCRHGPNCGRTVSFGGFTMFFGGQTVAVPDLAGAEAEHPRSEGGEGSSRYQRAVYNCIYMFLSKTHHFSPSALRTGRGASGGHGLLFQCHGATWGPPWMGWGAGGSEPLTRNRSVLL